MLQCGTLLSPRRMPRRITAASGFLLNLFMITTLSLLVAVSGKYLAPKGSLEHVVIKREGVRDVRLQCSNQSAGVYWTKDNVIIECADGGCRPTLCLRKVLRRDSGIYQCWMPPDKHIKPSFSVEVAVQRDARPRLLEPWTYKMSVIAGNPISLQCRVYSALPPKIQWFKLLVIDISHTSLAAYADLIAANKTMSYEGNLYEVLNSHGEATLANYNYLSKLTVYPASEDDTGLYFCVAVNTHGMFIRNASLTVLPRASDGLLVPQGGLLNVEVAMIVLLILLVAAAVIALTYLAYRAQVCTQPAPASL